ncbi:ABC transporter substrate-binding protein [Acidovorax sp. SUPP950]|uniref:ABC transporter substrate-binding protein n=1 Tax=Acidovorax sp. SUPP950 TaxID=511901 RepID=UPI0023CD023C|nr:ABC transporter substrate-binding protein [Acidovorax sp. SUPP950]GKS73585.1 ABC transporter substrate-binding protein [Acidovorax sp. SUPP950]
MDFPRIRRRHFGTLSALSMAAWAGADALAVPSPFKAGTGPLRVAVGGSGLLYHLPLTIAQELGFFRAEGLHVVVQDYPGGALALQALQDGEADVCSGAYDHVLRQQLQGRSYCAIVLQGRAPQLALAASTRAWPVKSVSRFKGMRVGVSALGSSTHHVAQLMLSRDGAPLDEVSFVGVGSALGAVAALRQGRVHALCHADPIVSALEQRAEVRVLCDTRSLKGSQELFGGTMPAASLYAPQSFVQKQPARSQALANAMVHALKWLQTASPADLVRAVPSGYLLGERGAYLAAFHKVRDTFSPDGLMPDDGPANAARVVARLRSELAPLKIDLGRTFTNEFARKAKQKFNA